jgi:hypothetical protein
MSETDDSKDQRQVDQTKREQDEEKIRPPSSKRIAPRKECGVRHLRSAQASFEPFHKLIV